jgi:hypothetical protein
MSSTAERFIEKAKQVHGDKYDYSLVEYKNMKTKVKIICPIHGEFWQTPSDHLQKHGCGECGLLKNAKENAKTTEQFVKDAKKIHGDKYDYYFVNYINNHTKVGIICREHGVF